MATEQKTEQQSDQSAQSSRELTRSGTGNLKTEHGTTTIADSVVAKVAGIGAREVPGVYAMGGAPARAIGNVTQRVGISDQRSQGVSVEVGERQAAADVTLVVEYGEAIQRVTDEVRQNVIKRIEGLCGLEVTEVNISVTDLHFPGDESDANENETEPRVA